MSYVVPHAGHAVRVRPRLDAQDLAAQVVRVGRRVARVVAVLVALVDRRPVAVRVVRVDVVADAEVQVALRVEVHPGAAGVGRPVRGCALRAAVAVGGHLDLRDAEDLLLVDHRGARSVELEARDHVVTEHHTRRLRSASSARRPAASSRRRRSGSGRSPGPATCPGHRPRTRRARRRASGSSPPPPSAGSSGRTSARGRWRCDRARRSPSSTRARRTRCRGSPGR